MGLILIVNQNRPERAYCSECFSDPDYPCLFQLRILAQDQGEPQKSDELFVEVTIIRDQGQLRFSTELYEVRISENMEVRQEVTRVAAAPSVSIL